jgi:hypothetical protein
MACAGLPFVVRAVLPDDPDFAYLALGLGCGVLAAVRFAGSPSANPRFLDPKDPWIAMMLPVFVLACLSAAVFVLFRAVPRKVSGLPIPLLAFLALTPGLGLVPYLTLRIGRPFAAIVFAAFIVASIKLASCVVVRVAYGPTALEDGFMSGDWQAAKVMISLFWLGTLTVSGALAIASRRLLRRKQSFAPA